MWTGYVLVGDMIGWCRCRWVCSGGLGSRAGSGRGGRRLGRSIGVSVGIVVGTVVGMMAYCQCQLIGWVLQLFVTTVTLSDSSSL